jgi:hypothetical protein
MAMHGRAGAAVEEMTARKKKRMARKKLRIG